MHRKRQLEQSPNSIKKKNILSKGSITIYIYQDQREINLHDLRKNKTETEEIIPLMIDKDLQGIRYIKKVKDLVKIELKLIL